ncbi:hypothetical protein MMC21_003429 [Puttea exsequens]|nr:hypothetical protein [Puttea exsequens]
MTQRSSTNNALSMSSDPDEEALEDEVTRLEKQLCAARIQLASKPSVPGHLTPPSANGVLPSHPLLLLSDSALPLGSFAFSSGLESYLAHHPITRSSKPSPNSFSNFLIISLTSLATTTLPYLIAAYMTPAQLEELDVTLDACTLCPVARRASIAQGKALLTLWDRALHPSSTHILAATTLSSFSKRLRAPPTPSGSLELVPAGHFALIWAVCTLALGLTQHESVYTFFFNHAKAVVSAAVRASVMGPYKAQELLAGEWLRGRIETVMRENWGKEVDEAGQGVPMVDLWVGRHELLYSRIFNS